MPRGKKKVNLPVNIVSGKRPKKTVKTVESDEGCNVGKKEIAKREMKKIELDPDKVEKDKRLIMWTGITFFIVLIIGFWLMNIKSILRINPVSQSVDSSSQINWNSFREELNKTMTQIKQNLSEINQLRQADQATSSTVTQPSLTPDLVNQLKNNLLESVIKEKATSTNK